MSTLAAAAPPLHVIFTTTLPQCPAPLQSQPDSRETHVVAPNATPDELVSPALLQSTLHLNSRGHETINPGGNIPAPQPPGNYTQICAQEHVGGTPQTTSLPPIPREHSLALDMRDQSPTRRRHQSTVETPRARHQRSTLLLFGTAVTIDVVSNKLGSEFRRWDS